jgi:hypothetical protein
MVEKAIKACNCESDVSRVVDRFINGFFEREEDCLSFDEVDHLDDMLFGSDPDDLIDEEDDEFDPQDGEDTW